MDAERFPPSHAATAAWRRDELSFAFQVPWQALDARVVTPRKLQNAVRLREEMARGEGRLEAFPWKLTVEPINACNLRCPACFTGAGKKGRERSHFPMDVYERLLDEVGSYLFQITFCNWGEPLLSPNLEQMITLARARGIGTLFSTNFSLHLEAERAESLVRSGLTTLGVSIDGAQQHVYEKYRVRGNLERVLSNCRLIVETKRRLASATPELIWSYHVFPFNEDDIELARKTAEEIGMSFAVSKGFLPGPDFETQGGYEFYPMPAPVSRCAFLWEEAVVNNDGGVPPCCATFYREDDHGKISLSTHDEGQATFLDVWNNDRFRAARALFTRESVSKEAESTVCSNCPVALHYRDWDAHVARGGSVADFSPQHTGWEAIQYFLRRVPDGGEPIVELRRPARARA